MLIFLKIRLDILEKIGYNKINEREVIKMMKKADMKFYELNANEKYTIFDFLTYLIDNSKRTDATKEFVRKAYFCEYTMTANEAIDFLKNNI